MSKPLQGGIAKLVYKSLKQAKMTISATLIKVTEGARGGTVSAGQTPTEAGFAAKGFVPLKHAQKIGDTVVQQDDRVVCLLGASIAGGQVPTSNDRVTIDGETLRIIDVQTDAAKAVYTIVARR
jgi:hypothetical protein